MSEREREREREREGKQREQDYLCTLDQKNLSPGLF